MCNTGKIGLSFTNRVLLDAAAIVQPQPSGLGLECPGRRSGEATSAAPIAAAIDIGSGLAVALLRVADGVVIAAIFGAQCQVVQPDSVSSSVEAFAVDVRLRFDDISSEISDSIVIDPSESITSDNL